MVSIISSYSNNLIQLSDPYLGAKSVAKSVENNTKEAYNKTVNAGGKGQYCFYFMLNSNTYILVVLAVKSVKNTANNVTDKTISAVQGAGKKGKDAANKVGKETTSFAKRIRKSVENIFGNN